VATKRKASAQPQTIDVSISEKNASALQMLNTEMARLQAEFNGRIFGLLAERDDISSDANMHLQGVVDTATGPVLRFIGTK